MLVSFFVDSDKIDLLPCCREVTSFQKIPKYYWEGFRSLESEPIWIVQTDSLSWPLALLRLKATINCEINSWSRFIVIVVSFFCEIDGGRYGAICGYCCILLISPVPGRLFRTFERHGGLFDPCQRNCCKSCLFHPNYLKLGTTHLWTLTNNNNISHVFKIITSLLFLMTSSFNNIFFKFLSDLNLY